MYPVQGEGQMIEKLPNHGLRATALSGVTRKRRASFVHAIAANATLR
jgi:hypothetical protein